MTNAKDAASSLGQRISLSSGNRSRIWRKTPNNLGGTTVFYFGITSADSPPKFAENTHEMGFQ